jgi:hypothetical protein
MGSYYSLLMVIAGLDPAIQRLDARVKPGHDKFSGFSA